MIPVKAILFYFAKAATIYVALALPIAGIGEVYNHTFRTLANGAFGSFGDDGLVRFEKIEHPRAMLDTRVSIRNLRNNLSGSTEFSTRLCAYLPTIEVIALVLATPINFKRRFRALFWALLLISAFVAARAYILILFCAAQESFHLITVSPTTMSFLSGLHRVGVHWASPNFVLPVFVWIIATIRREDIQRFTQPAPQLPS